MFIIDDLINHILDRIRNHILLAGVQRYVDWTTERGPHTSGGPLPNKEEAVSTKRLFFLIFFYVILFNEGCHA